jgi:hypothetical protein
MSDLYQDHNWNREARNVSERLDRNDVYGAQEAMRQDLYQLQNDPRAQHDFINMVNRYDRKGVGADLNIYRGPNGMEQWQITPPNYGNGRNPYPGDGRYPYPQPIPMPMPMPPEIPVPVPVPVPVPRRDPGEVIVDGIATGAGIAIGAKIMGEIFGHGHDRHRR